MFVDFLKPSFLEAIPRLSVRIYSQYRGDVFEVRRDSDEPMSIEWVLKRLMNRISNPNPNSIKITADMIQKIVVHRLKILDWLSILNCPNSKLVMDEIKSRTKFISSSLFKNYRVPIPDDFKIEDFMYPQIFGTLAVANEWLLIAD